VVVVVGSRPRRREDEGLRLGQVGCVESLGGRRQE
jgi:hypothetical protein